MLILEIRDNALNLINADSNLKKLTLKSNKIIEFEHSWKEYISVAENASALTEILKSYKEKKILLCLNTSSVIYRDMVVPKAKIKYLSTLIRNELSHALNLGNEYLIDYTILSETTKNNKKMHKILVAAILAPTLNEYIEYFDSIGIQVTHVDVALNSIQKFVEITDLVDKENNTLVVEVDLMTVRQYMFEKGKYSYYRNSKTATLSPTNEQLSLESITEIIEKMLQFSLSLGQDSAINKIVLFGAYPKIERLRLYLSDTLNIDTQIMSKPLILSGSKHAPFNYSAVYALGVLFAQKYKRKKDINLINPFNTFYSRKVSSINVDVLFNSLSFALVYMALFGIITINIQTNQVNAQIKKMNDYLTRPDVVSGLAEISAMKANITSLTQINAQLDSIQIVLDSIPRYTDIEINDILSVKQSNIDLSKIEFNNNVILLSIVANDASLIHEYILALSELKAFSDVTYVSYIYQDKLNKYTSEIALTLSGRID